MHANEHFLWMQGRFVGAEKANRNGAFCKTEDLELGELTVRHGPLNWLHESKHVIGTIAEASASGPTGRSRMCVPVVRPWSLSRRTGVWDSPGVHYVSTGLDWSADEAMVSR